MCTGGTLAIEQASSVKEAGPRSSSQTILADVAGYPADSIETGKREDAAGHSSTRATRAARAAANAASTTGGRQEKERRESASSAISIAIGLGCATRSDRHADRIARSHCRGCSQVTTATTTTAASGAAPARSTAAPHFNENVGDTRRYEKCTRHCKALATA